MHQAANMYEITYSRITQETEPKFLLPVDVNLTQNWQEKGS
jgi:hypothetical protein